LPTGNTAALLPSYTLKVTAFRNKKSQMNNFIANTFAEILGIIHLAAISCLGLAVWIYFENRKLGYGVFSEIEPAPFFLVIVAIFVCYIIFFGILSTFVAININIQKLVTHFENVKSNP